MENYVGKRLDGRYEIMEIIGVGGMAVVYKAFDNIDNRIVAVKILKDEFLANEDFRRRFKNESKAISVLSHKNIVKVYDVSYGDRLQYIVMEYVDGITLKEYIEQQGTINTREAVYFVTQILRALQHAHDKGIVHRDIKPQNIMLTSDGTIKVTDFGIARFSRSETETMNGQAIGSVHYISPEQAKGSVTDAKTDIYSVGVVLYEMLTGKLPFQSENAVSVALMQLQNDPVMPRDINPNIPVGLEQIVLRAMRKNINDRYQSASEMLMDIEKFKNNPNIKFDYSYFVDKQPTKYVSTAQAASPEAVRMPEEPKAVEPIEDNDYDEEPAVNEKSKKRTLIVLSGVLVVVVIFAAVLFAVFASGGGGYKVPNLVGLNFTEDVLNNEEYSMFQFEIVDDNDSEEESGTIIAQDPDKGKLERGGKITLTVAKAGTKVKVPDVYGYEYSSAEKMLKGENFEVTIVKESSETKEAGTVIRTNPARGEMADAGSLITLYVATNEETEPVDVPNLMGMTISEAEKALEDVGLVLDSEGTEYRASSATKGTIIGYDKIGEQALPGTAIAVYVSTGVVPQTVQTTQESTTEATTAAQTTEPATEETTEKPTEERTTKKPTTEEPATEAPTEAPTEKPTKPSTTAKPTEPSTTEKPTEPSTTKRMTTYPSTPQIEE
ncbi:MAG: Stk1 family PASTA domain-containing Ser/Thr kinase [Acutalibacteraceae bacterium]